MFRPALSPEAVGQAVADYVNAMLANPEALRGQQVRGGGPVADFEMLLSQWSGFPHCLTTSSATSALLVAALAAELSGKKIALEQDAWMGSVSALQFAGGEVVEVDSLLTAPLDGICAVLATDRPGTRHEATAVRSRCDKTGVLYIEDTGWLPGVTAPDRQFSLADIQVISFGPGKPMTLGEGGALLCRDETIYARAVSLSQHPERAIAEGFVGNSNHPLNARMHPVSALIGICLLRGGG